MNKLTGFRNFCLYKLRGMSFKRPLNMFECQVDTYDRFNKLDLILYKDIIDYKYNLNAKCKKSFEEICIDRANEISKKYDKIFICVSGGIDSSTIAASFYLTGNIDKCIIATDKKFLENKEILLPWIEKNNIKTLFFDEDVTGFSDAILANTTKNENYVIVNGHCGDQIDHGVMSSEKNFNDLDEQYENFFTLATNEKLKEWLSHFNFGDQIKTLQQLSWFFNFAVRWTDWETSSIFMYHQLPPKVHKPFFTTQNFTDWSLNNLDYILHKRESWDNKKYKPQFKQVLRKVFKDEFDNYGKGFSFHNITPSDYQNQINEKFIVATDGISLYNINFEKIDLEKENNNE